MNVKNMKFLIPSLLRYPLNKRRSSEHRILIAKKFKIHPIPTHTAAHQSDWLQPPLKNEILP